jgi:hypothetical protein
MPQDKIFKFNLIMKVTIEFDLDNPDKDDKANLEMALDAANMYLALWEFSHNAFKKLEWELESNDKLDKFDALQLFFNRFRETLEDHKIDLSKWE